MCPLSTALERNPNESFLGTQPSSLMTGGSDTAYSDPVMVVVTALPGNCRNDIYIKKMYEMNRKGYIKIAVEYRHWGFIQGLSPGSQQMSFLAFGSSHLYHQFLEGSLLCSPANLLQEATGSQGYFLV